MCILPAFVCESFVLFISCQFVYKSWPCSYLVGFVFKTLALFVSCESCPYPRSLTSFVDLICCCVENAGPIIQIIMGNDRSLLLARAEICRVCVPSQRVPEFWLSSRHAAFW